MTTMTPGQEVEELCRMLTKRRMHGEVGGPIEAVWWPAKRWDRLWHELSSRANNSAPVNPNMPIVFKTRYFDLKIYRSNMPEVIQ